MIKSISCAALSVALEQLKTIVKNNEDAGRRTVVFCEDRLSLAAERTVCAAVEGTFLTSVYTFARFLAAECGKPQNVLSAQGSAMAVRRIIEENRGKLTLFKQLASPTAAQAVYDTIALLYSSRISAEDIDAAAEQSGLLGGKLKDISLIYGEYMEYLKQNGLQDRNGYLKRLASVIEASPTVRGATVVFLGFQAFTCTTTECARAAFLSAGDVIGLFIGGKEDIYVNEASEAFIAAAKEFGGAEELYEGGGLLKEAEILRQSLFNPESFYKTAEKTTRVHIFEACDSDEELEFIAACIKRHVIDYGERYGQICVMLPNLNELEKKIASVFSRYRIPYYADRRIPLAEHPLCAFVFAWLSCALSGCRPQDVDGVVASPFFPAERADKDIFRNYALRLANYRGGVKRQPKKEILDEFNFDISAVERVREIFLKGYSLLTAKSNDSGIFGGLRTLLEEYGVKDRLKKQYEKFKDQLPVHAAFGARALEGVLSVLDEAESLSEGLPLKDIIKILKSGFSAMEISLIPPKADAVFVGDITSTANIGTKVVFAASLMGEVPSASADTALLTDREIGLLADANLNVSPKIQQVNSRKRETVALNICSFTSNLYLTYPTRLNGEEGGKSEIITYATKIFQTKDGNKLVPEKIKDVRAPGRPMSVYYATEKLPAIKQLLKLKEHPDAMSAVYATLQDNQYQREADAALEPAVPPQISCGKRFFADYSISPTTLETYFSCPYKVYMQQGLNAQERDEITVRPLDTGNFMHKVLEVLAKEVNGISDLDALRKRAEEIAADVLSKQPYSSLKEIKSGQYTVEELKSNAVKIAEGMYEHIKNSQFTVLDEEGKCEVQLIPGVKLYGKIDRIDECGDMVRIIDYKTGSIDGFSTAKAYYMGEKLQLPLYLLSVSKGKRAVGAYYFPASISYHSDDNGVFRMEGFMDGSEDVAQAMDKNYQRGVKSAYSPAKVGGGGKPADCLIKQDDFVPFLEYSMLVAGQATREMIGGNISPAPIENACDYCKYGGCCNFAIGLNGEEREAPSVNCGKIAQIVKDAKNSREDGNG